MSHGGPTIPVIGFKFPGAEIVANSVVGNPLGQHGCPTELLDEPDELLDELFEDDELDVDDDELLLDEELSQFPAVSRTWSDPQSVMASISA